MVLVFGKMQKNLVLSAGKTESFAFGLFFVYQQSAIPLKKIIDKYNGEASN